MRVLLTICARGGSKGVAKKNLRDIAGCPLIGHSIQQAKQWARAEEIIVSTDCEEISRVAREYGAKTPFVRPDALSGDAVGKVPVIRHAHLMCEEKFQRRFDAVVDLDVSAPIRRLNDIEGCYQKFLKQDPLTLFSVVEARKNPYFNMVETDGDGWARLSKQSARQTRRRQDAPKVYDLNASIYVYSRDFLVGGYGDNVVTERSTIFVMEPISAFDIDSELDLEFVNFLFSSGWFQSDV